MERGWRRHAPALALAVLSPAIAELLSGSTRITLVFYAPLWFALDFAGLMLFYGGGALLIREAAVRWGKGWASVLLLGAAYGIVEEGLAIHTFFQPVGGAVGALGSFGRWGGVDLLWALGLTAYHAVISIALPILLIELTFPATRGQRFLSRRSAIAVGAGYVGIVSLFAVVEPDFPSPELFALALGAVGLLVLAARWAPRNLLLPRPGRPSARPWAFVLAGSGLFVDWLIAGLAGPSLFPSAILAGSVYVAGLVAVLLSSSDPRGRRTYAGPSTGSLRA